MSNLLPVLAALAGSMVTGTFAFLAAGRTASTTWRATIAKTQFESLSDFLQAIDKALAAVADLREPDAEGLTACRRRLTLSAPRDFLDIATEAQGAVVIASVAMRDYKRADCLRRNLRSLARQEADDPSASDEPERALRLLKEYEEQWAKDGDRPDGETLIREVWRAYKGNCTMDEITEELADYDPQACRKAQELMGESMQHARHLRERFLGKARDVWAVDRRPWFLPGR